MIRISQIKNKKGNASLLRLQKDLADLDLPKSIVVTPTDTMGLIKTQISPDSGFYSDHKFLFEITIPDSYPHEPPKVKCLQTIYHPNISVDGAVCLNILRAEWNPILGLSSVLFGLLFLFHSPNDLDPLNHEAGSVLRESESKFSRIVKETLRGAEIDGIRFTKINKV
jgi:ubiquitin-conjugating enzyme E2 M